MKRKSNQLKVGIILGYLNMLVGSLIPLVYTPLMLNLLGKSEYGLYKLSSSAASYLSLIAFGIGSAVTRYLIKARTEDGIDAEENILGLFHVVFQGIAVIACIVGIAIAFSLEHVYSPALTQEELARMRILVIILSLNTAVSFSGSAYNAVVTSHERFVFLQCINILATCIVPTGHLIALYAGFASIGMVVTSLALNIVIRVLYVYYVRKQLNIRPRYKQMPVRMLKEILAFSFWVFVANVVSQLYNSTDTMIIGAIPALATTGVAVYNIGAVFNGMVFSMAQTVSTVFMPSVNKMVFSGADNKQLTDEVIRVGRIQCYVITLVVSGFIVFGRQFLMWYVGPEYQEAYWVAVFMMVPSCIPLVQSLANGIIHAKNKHQFRSITYLVIAIINVVGTYILVQKYGIVGAAFMTGMANVIGQGAIMNWYYWKRIGLDIPRFWRSILKIERIPAALCIVFLMLSRVVKFDTLGSLLLGILIYTLVYLILIYKGAMTDAERTVVDGPLHKVGVKISERCRRFFEIKDNGAETKKDG